MKQNSLFAIFRFSLLEVLRTRLWLFALLVVAIAYAVAFFAASLAITESDEYKIITFATLVRLLAVFVVCLFISNSVIRDFDDGVFELIISRPVSKVNWYVARISAFFALILGFASLCALPLLFHGAPHLIIWWSGFVGELFILASVTMAFAITLKNSTIAVTAVLSFYVLSRVISALVLMSARAATEIAQPMNNLVADIVKGISYVLPDLSRFADSSLLIASTELNRGMHPNLDSHLIFVIAQCALYCLLLSAVGLFDLYRRNM